MPDYPSDMDVECIPLCDALNSLPGIQTSESCCGHGSHNFGVAFKCNSFESLAKIAELCHDYDWFIEVVWENGSETLYFWLEGPIGPPDQPGGANDGRVMSETLERLYERRRHLQQVIDACRATDQNAPTHVLVNNDAVRVETERELMKIASLIEAAQS